MAEYGPLVDGAWIGGTGQDTFIIDPDTVGNPSIADQGGSDTLVIYGRPVFDVGPGYLGGSLQVRDGALEWSIDGGGSVSIGLKPDGTPVIEKITVDNPPDATDGFFPSTYRIVTDLSDLSGRRIAVAGTDGDDTIAAPQYRGVQYWSNAIFGGDGDDTLSGSNKWSFHLHGCDGDDLLIGVARENDEMDGDGGNDTLQGNRGNDALDGGAGADRLFGGKGLDELSGDLGRDLLVGGVGADEFHYVATAGNEGRDTIRGFVIGQDKIFLNGFANDASALRIDETSGGVLVTLDETGTSMVLMGISLAEVLTAPVSLFEFV
jgi:Ca2+-binding RTX toxin-like protein